ncbi:hypothetical protein KIN20_024829 [Parelaphostrongylus tenuis]|uniref:Uncharacterized protein n=1 Tax=Parelaphostrongylus tenuis TaxID=148309 RepID=A0AAD5QW88_PARTN|nr:hypothetical protein KIN20_024829 [Parelaphostrongylus tenuis]
MFRVGIDSSDGSSTYELPSKPFLKDLPYHNSKGRFPTALFEYFEKRKPSPRVLTGDEPRRDGARHTQDGPGLEQLLSVLLSFVEQHAIPVCEVEKVTERALLPTPAIEVTGTQHSCDHRQRTMTARQGLQFQIITNHGVKVLGYTSPMHA